MWNPSYSPSYFSLPDILADHERVPVVTNVDLPNLGFLDPSSRSSTLPKGTKLELPLWMAKGMKAKRRSDISMPPSFTEKMRQIVAADPSAVNLHQLGPTYYETGRLLMKLESQEAEEIGLLLRDTLTKRFRSIMDASNNAAECDLLTKTEKMDDLEKILYHQGQKSKKHYDLWSKRQTGQIKTSSMVQRLNKRKASVL